MKNFFIKLISGIILFFFIGLSISDLIDDYTYSVGQFPMILFTSFTLIYIIQFTDYIRLMIDVKTYRGDNNKSASYIQTEESSGRIKRTNLATIAMTIIYMIPTIIYTYHTNSIYNLIIVSGRYIIFAFLMNDMLVQIIKEKTFLQNNTTIK
jgi:hypothetical protein